MIIAPEPANEANRLSELYACEILDTPDEEAFDALARVAASICEAPICLVSLIDKERQWFKAKIGLGVDETPRDQALCSHAILHREIFEVQNTLEDVRFHDNPLVLGQPDIRFYAGVPLITADNFALGTLCVIDRKPRRLTSSQQGMLKELAGVAVRLIETRKSDAALQSLGRLLDQSSMEVYVCDLDAFGIVEVNAEVIRSRGYSRADLTRRTLPDLLSNVSPEDLGAIVSLLRQGEETYIDLRGFLRSKEGGETPCEIRYQLSRYRGHAVLTVLVKDNSELRNAEKKARQTADYEARLSDANEQLLVTTEHLQETNRLLVMAEETAHIGHWRLDLINGQSYWSDEVYRIHGFPLDEKPDPSMAIDAYIPEDRARALATFMQAAEKGAPFSQEFRVLRPDGTIREVVSMGQAERGADGAITGIFGVFQDITERKAAERELTKLNERVTLANQAGRVGVWEWHIPNDTMVWDRAMFDIYGMASDAGEMSSKAAFHAILGDDIENLSLQISKAFSEGMTLDAEFRIKREDGEIRHIRTRGAIIRDDAGNPQRFLGTNWDVTEVHNLTAQLYEEKERLQVTLYSIGDAVVTTDEHARILFVNPAAEIMLGYTSAEARGMLLDDVFHLVHDQTGDEIASPVARCLKDETIYSLEEGAVLINRGGKAYDIQDSAAPIRTRDGKIVGAVLVFQDVTKARDLQRTLSFNATHDELTGLCNRTKFESDCKHTLDLTRRSGATHALCYLDLDRFKIVNDSAGHAAGDMLLREIAKVLSHQLRATDIVARLGGDEFGLLLYDCPTEKARESCVKLIELIGSIRLPWEGKFYDVGASIGIVAVTADAPTLGELMSQADVACYASKRAGRNRVSIYHPGQSDVGQHHREILQAAGLREAIEANRFILFAQDIIPTNPAESAERRFELLIRMLDEDGGFIPPGAFIPAAERFGLMTKIDQWVVRQALIEQGQAIAEHGNLKIAINLSANSLSDPMFLPFLLQIIAQSPVRAELIQFEITETAMMSHLAVASKLVTTLQEIGCTIALDDFGSGLSSFNYLKHFPIDEIKIDGSFVRNIDVSPKDLAIVESINAISHRLGARTVAEFVENAAIFNVLQTIGVDFAQGYAIGRPASLKSKLIDFTRIPSIDSGEDFRKLTATR